MKARKSFILSILLIVSVMFITVFQNVTNVNAETKTDPKVKYSVCCTINGVERSLKILDDRYIYFKNGNSEPMCVYSDHSLISLVFDSSGTCWVYENDKVLRWWSYDLIPDRAVFKVISRPTDNRPGASVDDVESIILDNQGFIIGYKISSGESFYIPTIEEMRAILTTEDPFARPTPRPMTELPSTNPEPTPVVTTDDKPVVTPSVTTNTKVTVKKKSGFTCLYTGTKVTSKYKLKKGNLTWKSGKKVKKFKGIKSAGFIKKSKNLIFMTKSGKVYTISSKGKKKTIVKKGAKKLIFSGKFVTKVKKKSGSVNVTRK